ncbi:SHOCT domain-containing protein [Haloarchaeobius sp. TZWWS8]|uniref:SHOCT domain-containing protein n=1 Tax=Haloarchaeobius sp. TZWWS8 TaxID=3446121 RepID=UPI003EB7A1C0
MKLLSSPKVKALTAGIVLTLFALVGVSLWGLLQTVAAIGTAGSTPLLVAMVSAGAPWLVAAVLLTLLSSVLTVWLLLVLVSQVSLPRLQSERLSKLAGFFEYRVPGLPNYGIADWLAPPEPTVEERRDTLTERYVAGELSDAEFERKLQRLYEQDEGLEPGRMRDDLDMLLDDSDSRASVASVESHDVTGLEQSGR